MVFMGGSKANYFLTAVCVSTISEDYKYACELVWIVGEKKKKKNISLHSPF